MQIKTMLDETRNQLQTSKNQHMRQIELMESEELIAQKKVRSEMIQMEDVLAQIRREYEALRIEYEQNMAANEQTAPINREMRHLITSLQNHNAQLKGEGYRYKRKYKDASADNVKLRRELEEAVAKLEGTKQQNTPSQGTNGDDIKHEGAASVKEEFPGSSGGSGSSTSTSADGLNVKEEGSAPIKSEDETMDDDLDKDLKDGIKKEQSSPGGPEKKEQTAANASGSTPTAGAGGTGAVTVKQEKDAKDAQKAKEVKVQESEIVRDLKAQLK